MVFGCSVVKKSRALAAFRSQVGTFVTVVTADEGRRERSAFLTSHETKKGELTTTGCLINSGNVGWCCRNGRHRCHGSATLGFRGGGDGGHSGTTSWCGREGFRIGGLTTLGIDAFGIGGGGGSGFAVRLLLADDPPHAGRFGGDFVSLDFLGIHIPYDRITASQSM